MIVLPEPPSPKIPAHRPRWRGRFATVLVLPIAACTLGARGGEGSPEGESAKRVMQAMCDTLSGSESFYFKVNVEVDELLENGKLARFSETQETRLARPGHLQVDVDSEVGSWSLTFREGALTVLDNSRDAWAETETGKSVDDMLAEVTGSYDITIPLSELCRELPNDGVYDSIPRKAMF